MPIPFLAARTKPEEECETSNQANNLSVTLEASPNPIVKPLEVLQSPAIKLPSEAPRGSAKHPQYVQSPLCKAKPLSAL